MRVVWLVCALWSLSAQVQASAPTEPQTLRCLFGTHPCSDGSECVPFSHVCDGESDCPDGSDEAACESECSPSQFQCAHGRRCVERSEVCDGEAQCSDRSDEEGCVYTDEVCVHRCDKIVCLHAAAVCDGERDCPDGSDEADCRNRNDAGSSSGGETERPDTPRPPAVTTPDTPRSPSVTTPDTPRPPAVTTPDTPRSPSVTTADTPRPPAVTTPVTDCPAGSRLCRDGGACVPHQLFCDGGRDCGDGSDEDECPTPCTSGELECDGQACAGDRWRCPDSRECVEGRRVCDGERDCADGTDEQNCTAVDVPSGSESPPPPQPGPSDGPGLETAVSPPRPFTPGSPDGAVTDPDVKSGGVASCGPRECHGNGECVVQDGSVVCECRAGYGGARCEEQGGVLQGPAVYAAAGVGVALVVIGAIIVITRRKRSANRRRARPIVRETSMRDLGNRCEPSPAQKDPESPQGP